MARISWRISSATFGLPPRHRDFHRQNKRNPARCQRITVSGRTITKALGVNGHLETRDNTWAAFSFTAPHRCANGAENDL